MLPRNRTLPLWRVEQRGDRDRAIPMVTKPPLATNKAVANISGTSGGILFGVMTTTGFAKVDWWDGTSSGVLGNGDPENFLTSSKTLTAAAGKTATLYSVNGLGGDSGSVLVVQNFSPNLASIDLSEAANITTLGVAAGNWTATDWGSLTKLQLLTLTSDAILSTMPRFENCPLTSVNIAAQNVTEVDFGYQPNLDQVFMLSTSLKSLNVQGCIALNSFYLYNTQVQSLNLRNLSMLNTVVCINNASMTHLDITGSSAERINAQSNGLTSVAAKGCSPSAGKYKKKIVAGLNVADNNMSASALNSMFDDLDPADPIGGQTPIIIVYNNPGSATCDPTIATSKGYVVIT